ncbi:flagellar associated protein [Planoprotostelium fungivorum]|uniref:Flagellar associated protein n=1 Tax=Planoprotostelium fungivorum TaxID=1890364 RepID=A0A2P6NU61_9EUKA|nr:flagellar associated protein [Planoprotostelium fungivorum]
MTTQDSSDKKEVLEPSSQRFVDKKKEVAEVQAALDIQKEEFVLQEGELRHREDILRRKDLELQESLVKFNRFLQDNNSKRSDAERKHLQVKREREYKEQEIHRLAESLETLKNEGIEKESLLEKHRKYEEFLNSVLERTDEYKEIKFLVERWKILKDTGDQLRRQTEESTLRTESQSKSMQKYMEEKNIEILNYNNIVASLQNRLEARMDGLLQGENAAEERSKSILMHNLEASQIKM